MATIPAAGYISNAARTQSEVQTALEDIVASLRQVPGAGQVGLSHTLSGDAITPAGSGGVIVVDTEASAATDDLKNIITTNYPDGSCLFLRNANNARFVVAKHLGGGAGQLNLDRSVDYTLDDTNKWLLVQRRGADWYEILRGPIRMTSLTMAKSSTFTVNKEDLGKVALCTGTFTANLLAATAAGSGFVIGIRNVSTGTITIDPNSSELIDGAATLLVLPGWSYLLVCDGTAWRSIAATGPVPAENPVINGTMEVWQRGTSFVSPTNGVTAADRWRWAIAGAGIVTINRSTNVPTIAQAGVLLNYSLEVDVTTVDASIATGDFYGLVHRIEGGTWRHFAQRQFTVSFWVSSSKTGIHCVAFRNAATTDRSYIAEYTINSANTWEYKQITVTASPSAGNWNYANGTGLELAFMLAAGATYQTTANAWQTGDFLATSSQVNCLDSTSNFFRLASVKLELGPIATPLDVVGADVELVRCLRYYQKSFAYATAPVQNAGSNTGEFVFTCPVGASTLFNSVTIPVSLPMRSAPTITTYNPNAANIHVRNRNTNTDCTGTTGYNAGEKSFALQATTPAGTTTSHTMVVHWAAESEL